MSDEIPFEKPAFEPETRHRPALVEITDRYVLAYKGTALIDPATGWVWVNVDERLMPGAKDVASASGWVPVERTNPDTSVLMSLPPHAVRSITWR
jgi:hypothetical protein